MRTFIFTALLALASVAAQAQTVLPPGQPVTVAWDAPASSAANAPKGYRFETFRETDTGVTITTTDVPLNPTQATLPSSVLPPDGAWLLAVRAFNDAGVSARSNALPFVRPEAPAAPVNLRYVPPQ